MDVVNPILTTLLVVLGVLVGWTMFKYDFLNFRGINFGVIIVIMISIIVSVFLIIKKKAKVFNTIMLILMNIVLIFSYVQFRTAIGLFENLNNNAAFSEYTMSVVVLKDDKASKLADLKGDSVGAPVSSDGVNINKLMKEIRDKEKQTLDLKETKNYITAYDELTAASTRAMILNSSYEDFIVKQHADFKDKTKKYMNLKLGNQ